MDVIDLLGDPAYRHMLLNHVPIVGLAVSLLALLAGVVLRQHAITLLGLVLVALTAGRFCWVPKARTRPRVSWREEKLPTIPMKFPVSG